MTPEETAAFDTLRGEVEQLRRELDRVLERLDRPNSREPGHQPAPYLSREFSKVCVRRVKEHIPVVLSSHEDRHGMFLYDANAKARAMLMIDGEGRARLEIRNAAGKTVLMIGEGEHGGGDVLAFGPEGEPRAAMRGMSAAGVVNVVDAQGRVMAGMAGMAEGSELVLFTPAQRKAVAMKATDKGGVLTVHEPGGQVMGFLIATADGGTLSLTGEQGSPAATLTGHGETGGNAVFYHADGTDKAMLP